jgi:ATP-dependent protease ClpP protease subunit
MASNKIPADDVDKFFDYGVFVPSRTLYIGSYASDWEGAEMGVNHAMAERAIKGLHVLERLAPMSKEANDDINIIMNNPGGEWYHGMAIFDAILGCDSHVTIRATGHAMSMGSIILQAADERVMTPNAKFMIHYGTSGFNNHTKIVQQWAKEDKKVCAQMEQIYMEKITQKHPNFTLKKLRAMLNFDTILTAQETVDLGLADRVG